jgi:hypothetical protein
VQVCKVHRKVDQTKDCELGERTLLIEGVHHLDVERRRLVESADGMIEEDVGVFEEPGRHDDGKWDSHEAGFCGEEEEEGEDEQNASCSPASGTEEMAGELGVGNSQFQHDHVTDCGRSPNKM